MSREPRHDNRSDGGYRTQERAGSSFGERGAALLGELRRMPAVLARQFDGEQRVPPASRNEDEGVASFVPRGRLTTPDHRQGRQNGALRAWLERLEIEDAKMRHEWAKTEMRRAGNSRALVRFVVDSLKELRILRTGRKLPDSKTP